MLPSTRDTRLGIPVSPTSTLSSLCHTIGAAQGTVNSPGAQPLRSRAHVVSALGTPQSRPVSVDDSLNPPPGCTASRHVRADLSHLRGPVGKGPASSDCGLAPKGPRRPQPLCCPNITLPEQRARAWPEAALSSLSRNKSSSVPLHSVFTVGPNTLPVSVIQLI